VCDQEFVPGFRAVGGTGELGERRGRQFRAALAVLFAELVEKTEVEICRIGGQFLSARNMWNVVAGQFGFVQRDVVELFGDQLRGLRGPGERAVVDLGERDVL
jgi:hypothetical protein